MNTILPVTIVRNNLTNCIIYIYIILIHTYIMIHERRRNGLNVYSYHYIRLGTRQPITKKSTYKYNFFFYFTLFRVVNVIKNNFNTQVWRRRASRIIRKITSKAAPLMYKWFNQSFLIEVNVSSKSRVTIFHFIFTVFDRIQVTSNQNAHQQRCTYLLNL